VQADSRPPQDQPEHDRTATGSKVDALHRRPMCIPGRSPRSGADMTPEIERRYAAARRCELLAIGD
jgi:hypothetical protein